MLHVKNIVLGLVVCSPMIALAADDATPTAEKWTYNQCLDYAYSKNINLQQLILANQQDQATLEQSKAQWTPSLSFSTNQGFTNYPIGASNQSKNIYSGSYGLNASWIVFNGNIRRNQIKYDEMQQQISALGIDDYRYTLQTEILTRYLNILYAKEAITIAEDNLAVSKYQMERAETLMKSGKLSRVDYSEIESQYHNDKYSLTQAESSLSSAKLSLKTLLELNIASDFDVADIDFDDSELSAELPRKTDVYDSACSWMPSLQRYKLASEAQQYNIDIARGGYYPTVSLNAGVGTSSTVTSNNGSVGSSTTAYNGNVGTQMKNNLNEQIALNISVPIWDQKKTKTAVTKAKIAQLNADLDYQNAATTLSQTIENIYIEAENAQAQYESCTEKLKSAELTDELVNQQFTLGKVNTLDLLNAHSALISAQQAQLQAKYMTVLNKRLLAFYQTQQISL